MNEEEEGKKKEREKKKKREVNMKRKKMRPLPPSSEDPHHRLPMWPCELETIVITILEFACWALCGLSMMLGLL